MIPAIAFLLGFALGYYRTAKAGGGTPDRLHRGIVTGLALALASLLFGFLFEAILRA